MGLQSHSEVGAEAIVATEILVLQRQQIEFLLSGILAGSRVIKNANSLICERLACVSFSFQCAFLTAEARKLGIAHTPSQIGF